MVRIVLGYCQLYMNDKLLLPLEFCLAFQHSCYSMYASLII